MTIDPLSKISPVKGEYYLVERSKVDELYTKNGFTNEEEVPNYLSIDGKECLFTENFIELDGVEYEIVMVANGFSWENILTFDEDE